MSLTTHQPRGLHLPKPKPPIVPVSSENVRDWWALFVNRKAYTRQSANPHPETGRHYHYQPKNKHDGRPAELDPDTVRKHLAGWLTVGLYAINSQSQRCKWIAIDADYEDAFFDLGKLKSELELDGVSAALEMSRRGGHLWILCEQPLLAQQCRVYIYNVALSARRAHQGRRRSAGRHRNIPAPGQTRAGRVRQCPPRPARNSSGEQSSLLVL
jgi:hypothetical protein